MKIIKFTKVKNDLYKLLLDNNNEIELYDEIIIKEDLLIKKEIKDLTNLLKQNEVIRIYFEIIKYISRKNKTKKEIIFYLIKKDYELDDINNAMDKVISEGYLNEDNYARAYINDQINFSNNGPLKIKKELIDKGIEEDIINNYLNNIDYDVWNPKITKLINYKIRLNNKYSKTKLIYQIIIYLNNKGYSREMVTPVLENINIKANDNIIKKDYNKLYNKLSKKYSNNELLKMINKQLRVKGYTQEEITNIVP